MFSAPVGGYVVNETFAVTFMCNATGLLPPTIQWYRDQTLLSGTMSSDFSGTDPNSRVVVDEPTIESSLGEVSTVSRSLTVMNAMDGDTGTYRCEATNEAMNGTDMENFELFVQRKSGINVGIILYHFLERFLISSPVSPTVVALDDDQEIIANESESAMLSFRIDRAAPPVPVEDIRWFYSAGFSATPDGGMDITNLTSRTSVSTLLFSADLLTLSIDNIVQARMAGEETDQGRYFLVAKHPAGDQFSHIDVVVNGKLKCFDKKLMLLLFYKMAHPANHNSGPPLISTEPMDQTIINNGSNAMFMCFALAFPQHSVLWTFTNFSGIRVDIISTSDANDTSKYQIIRDSGSNRFGELTVLDVQFSDTGTYNCTAENSVGSKTRGANLTVHGKSTHFLY